VGRIVREERNAHRRARYEERRIVERKDPVREAQRRESSRLAERARRQANPEAVREEKRRWRKANADEVNRKQREYRRAPRGRSLAALSATAAQSAKNWNAYRHHHGSPRPPRNRPALGVSWQDSARLTFGRRIAQRTARADRTADSAPAAGPSRITGPITISALRHWHDRSLLALTHGFLGFEIASS